MPNVKFLYCTSVSSLHDYPYEHFLDNACEYAGYSALEVDLVYTVAAKNDAIVFYISGYCAERDEDWTPLPTVIYDLPADAPDPREHDYALHPFTIQSLAG